MRAALDWVSGPSWRCSGRLAFDMTLSDQVKKSITQTISNLETDSRVLEQLQESRRDPSLIEPPRQSKKEGE